jgi:hypothetical protein
MKGETMKTTKWLNADKVEMVTLQLDKEFYPVIPQEIFSFESHLQKAFDSASYKMFLSGGSLRDAILNSLSEAKTKKSKDLDFFIFTSLTFEQFFKQFQSYIHQLKNNETSFNSVNVITKHFEIFTKFKDSTNFFNFKFTIGNHSIDIILISYKGNLIPEITDLVQNWDITLNMNASSISDIHECKTAMRYSDYCDLLARKIVIKASTFFPFKSLRLTNRTNKLLSELNCTIDETNQILLKRGLFHEATKRYFAAVTKASR